MNRSSRTLVLAALSAVLLAACGGGGQKSFTMDDVKTIKRDMTEQELFAIVGKPIRGESATSTMKAMPPFIPQDQVITLHFFKSGSLKIGVQLTDGKVASVNVMDGDKGTGDILPPKDGAP